MRWTISKRLAVLSVSLLLPIACQTAEVFPYKYYGLGLPDYDGLLLGPDASKDLPFTLCAPDEASKGKCVVLFTDEFQAMRTERLRLKEQLKECQAR